MNQSARSPARQPLMPTSSWAAGPVAEAVAGAGMLGTAGDTGCTSSRPGTPPTRVRASATSSTG